MEQVNREEQRNLNLPPTAQEKVKQTKDVVKKAYYLAIADKLHELGFDLTARLRISAEIREEAENLINLFEEE